MRHEWRNGGTTRTCRACGTIESGNVGPNAKGFAWGTSGPCDGEAAAVRRKAMVADRYSVAKIENDRTRSYEERAPMIAAAKAAWESRWGERY